MGEASALLSALPDAGLFLMTTVLAVYFTSLRYPEILAFLKRQLPPSWQVRCRDAAQCFRSTILKWLRAEMLLLFSLQRQDVMSYGDYGLRVGLCRLYHHQDMPEERFRRYQRRFSPYGSAASLVLWEIAAGRAPEACALPLRECKG